LNFFFHQKERSGLFLSWAGDGHRMGSGKVEDFKANPHNLSESMDSGELSDGASMGEAHQVHGFPRS